MISAEKGIKGCSCFLAMADGSPPTSSPVRLIGMLYQLATPKCPGLPMGGLPISGEPPGSECDTNGSLQRAYPSATFVESHRVGSPREPLILEPWAVLSISIAPPWLTQRVQVYVLLNPGAARLFANVVVTCKDGGCVPAA